MSVTSHDGSDFERRPDTFLARVPLFAGLDHDVVRKVAALGHWRHYPAGQSICQQGDPSDSVFVLRSGFAQAFVTPVIGSGVTTVARLRPGDVIGEIGIMTNLPRSATVVARSPAVVLEIGADRFARLLAREPRLQANLTHLLAGRLARRNADLRGRSGHVAGVVVGPELARAATRVVAAARRASPNPFTVIDLRSRPAIDDAAAILGEAERVGSVAQVLERLDTMSATRDAIVVADHDQDDLGVLLERVDRVLALLAGSDAAALARTLRTASQVAELVLSTGGTGTEPPESHAYRLLRRCGVDVGARDAAWLGRHLSRTKLGLALGAGGAKAFAHAGVIQALERAGYCVDYVAGSSMGAVVAVWLALGMTGAEIAATLSGRCGPEAVADAIFRQGAAGDGIETFTRIFRATTSDRSFEDLLIPATVMTADLAGRCPCPITSGPLWEALMAALAIPGLYAPWIRGEQRLVDAVSLTPVPLDWVVAAGADITIAVNLLGLETMPQWPGDDGSRLSPPHGMGHARDTVVEALELAQIGASAAQTARADVPITPVFGPGTWRQMQHGDRFLSAGDRAAETGLARLAMLARPTRALA